MGGGRAACLSPSGQARCGGPAHLPLARGFRPLLCTSAWSICPALWAYFLIAGMAVKREAQQASCREPQSHPAARP